MQVLLRWLSATPASFDGPAPFSKGARLATKQVGEGRIPTVARPNSAGAPPETRAAALLLARVHARLALARLHEPPSAAPAAPAAPAFRPPATTAAEAALAADDALHSEDAYDDIKIKEPLDREATIRRATASNQGLAAALEEDDSELQAQIAADLAAFNGDDLSGFEGIDLDALRKQ